MERMAGLYKENAGLGKRIIAEREYEKEQQALKEKHNIEDENVVVVERPSFMKFLLSRGIAAVKLMAVICILCLATIGLLGLIYPEPREALLQIMFCMKSEIISMVGF